MCLRCTNAFHLSFSFCHTLGTDLSGYTKIESFYIVLENMANQGSLQKVLFLYLAGLTRGLYRGLYLDLDLQHWPQPQLTLSRPPLQKSLPNSSLF
jgi:hypothetical protein